MKKGYVFLGIVAAGLLLAPVLATSTYYITLLVYMLSFGILAMSLDILVGYCGLSSLGHAAFFGMGAYSVGLLNLRLGWGFVPATFGAILFTLILAALFGLLTSKITGVPFLMVNLALGQVMWGLAYRWASLSGGENGLPGIERPVILGMRLSSPESFYYFALFVAFICTAALLVFVNSPFGLAIAGIKQSPSRMRALGYNVWLYRYLTYIVSGVFGGIAGIIFAYYNCFVSPMELSIATSAKTMLMVILGGAGTLYGPMIGAAMVVLIENLASTYTERWPMILGMLYVVVVMYSRRGLLGFTRGVMGGQVVSQKKASAKVEGTADPHVLNSYKWEGNS